MEKHLFFLRKDGWVEAELTRKLMLAPHEELVRWACVTMEKYGYRNYMITENPHCIMAGHARIMPLYETGMVPVNEDTMNPAKEISGMLPAGRHTS